MGRVTKTQLVKSHLETKGSITSLEAINKYEATRLSAIIFNLRDKGMNIITQDIESIDKYGNKVVYGKYILRK
jgi:hypothetical protein